MVENSGRTCIACKVTKPATPDHFYYRNKARGWFSSWCKECRTSKRKETNEAELARQRERRERRGLKLCCTCGIRELPKGARCCKPCLTQRRRQKKRIDKSVYKGRLRKAMPRWADKAAIRRIYQDRPEGMHVDHIVPIRGEMVCGLHVESNLQYLPREVNVKKSNHYSMEWQGQA